MATLGVTKAKQILFFKFRFFNLTGNAEQRRALQQVVNNYIIYKLHFLKNLHFL